MTMMVTLMRFAEFFDDLRRKHRTAEFILSFFDSVTSRRLGFHAAGMTFYSFMSMIPLFVLLCSQLPYTGIRASELSEAISNIVPEILHELVIKVVNEAYSAKVALFSVSVVLLLWSSSKAMLSIIRALDVIYDVKERRKYFSVVGFSLLYTVIVLILTGSVLLIYTRSHSLDQVIASFFPTKEMFRVWAKHGHHLISSILLAVFFTLLYTWGPSKRRRALPQLPGAVFSSAGVSLLSVYFAIYNNARNIYRSFYGSLASIAILLLWIYFCYIIILLGGVINTHYKKTFEKVFRPVIKRKRRDRDVIPSEDAAEHDGGALPEEPQE